MTPNLIQGLFGKYFNYSDVQLNIRFSDKPVYLQGVARADLLLDHARLKAKDLNYLELNQSFAKYNS